MTRALPRSWQEVARRKQKAPRRKAAIGRHPRRRLTIQGMVTSAGRAQPADFSAGWARWASVAVFAALVAVAAVPMRPAPAAAAVATVVAVAAGALLAWRRRPLLFWAALASAGSAVLGYDDSRDVGWFAVCLVAVWCGFAGRLRDADLFLGGAIALFTAEWS